MPYVTANGVRTHFEMVGDGPPLLLIAGNGMDHTAFRDQVPSFALKFRCITYDLRGVGQSDVPQSGYTTPEMARDAVALLSALGFESAHIAGYSLGGAIAQWMAANRRASAGHSWEIYGDPTPDPADTETTVVYHLK